MGGKLRLHHNINNNSSKPSTLNANIKPCNWLQRPGPANPVQDVDLCCICFQCAPLLFVRFDFTRKTKGTASGPNKAPRKTQ